MNITLTIENIQSKSHLFVAHYNRTIARSPCSIIHIVYRDDAVDDDGGYWHLNTFKFVSSSLSIYVLYNLRF